MIYTYIFYLVLVNNKPPPLVTPLITDLYVVEVDVERERVGENLVLAPVRYPAGLDRISGWPDIRTVGLVENISIFFLENKNLYLLFSRISGIRLNDWPDIRSNQYPVKPYYPGQGAGVQGQV